MRKLITLAAALVALAIPAAASAATTPVTSLAGDWGATNSTLRLTTDGVNFGVYPTAESGGSLSYGGANGLTLADLSDLSYTFNYRALHEPAGYTAAPYLRVYLEGDTQDVVLDPSHCATAPVAQNTDVTLQLVGNSVRYSDDGCDGVAPDEQPWADVVAAHGTDVISGIYVTQGFAVGDSFSANVPRMTVNGTTFDFGAPQAGPAGAAGQDGQDGAVQLVTSSSLLTQTVIAPQRLVGDNLRVLHAPKRAGARFVKVRAWLLTPSGQRTVPVRRNAVRVDLTGKPAGNYNVRLKTTYRSKRTGRTFSRVSFRNLSVTLAK